MTYEYTVKNNDFSEYDNNPGLILDRIDRNNTHYYTDPRCPKCGGTGYIDYYSYVDGGICFLCGGSGRYGTKFIVRTAEYAKKLEDRRTARIREKAKEINAEFFKKNGISSDGSVFIVLCKSYEIKEQLKVAGALYTNALGWYFDHNVTEWPVAEIKADDVVGEWENGDPILFLNQTKEGLYYIEDDGALKWHCIDLRRKYEDAQQPKTEFFGNVGDKIDTFLTLVRCSSYETIYGDKYVYTFDDNMGHRFVWKTTLSTLMDMQAGRFHVRGTIKEHSEYRGINQTIITRCKTEAI